jgi:hypothetical protein
VARLRTEPHRIQLVPPDEVNQAGLPTPFDVSVSLFPINHPAQLRVDTGCGFPKKEAAQINGVVLATCPIAAQAGVHDPAMAGLIDEVRYDLGREDGAPWLVNLLQDFDLPRFREQG